VRKQRGKSIIGPFPLKSCHYFYQSRQRNRTANSSSRAMKRGIKLVAGAAMTRLGIPRLLHRTIFRNQLTIVMYHGVVRKCLGVKSWCFIDESSFREQIHYLKRYFRVVRFSEAVELLKEGRIDRPTVVITFDDGFQNNYDIAFPILRAAGLPAIIFLTTGLLNSGDTLWFCRIHSALAQTQKPHFVWDGTVHDLGTAELRARASSFIRNRLKDLPGPDLAREVHNMVAKLGIDPDEAIDPRSPFRMLSYESIERMFASGIIQFGAHTHSHAILSRLDCEERRKEINTSVRIVTGLIGQQCQFFAYPNGRKQDYDEATIAILRGCGIRAAVTTRLGPNVADSSLMELTRYGFGADDTAADFSLAVHHIKHYLTHSLGGSEQKAI
jgi:peptidoglycan/xylan/chitin deacetylase (PgdA/CDA1 family)